MKPFLFFVLLLLYAPSLSAQSDDYSRFVGEAESLFQKGEYAAASKAYSAAFKSLGWKGSAPDRYNAARAWSLAGVPDSAFFNLFRLAEKMNYDKLDVLTAEKAFESLHALPRWTTLCALVKSNQPSMPELAKELAVIYVNDQRHRQNVDSIRSTFGDNSPQMNALWRIMSIADSNNMQRVTQILDTYGWLGAKAVGAQGNSTLFLVIQHSDLEVQEKYLPMMREAVKTGNALGADLALLEDRVLMRRGKKQIYGSQVQRDKSTGKKAFAPIEDVEHVDARRASVGLEPLAEYAKRFGIVWDAAAIEANKNGN